MNAYDLTLKSLRAEIRKCKATAHAKSVGATGKWNENGTPDGTLDEIIYDDGTSIRFNPDGTPHSLTYGDYDMRLLDLGAEGFFRPQKQYITMRDGTGGYSLFEQYVDAMNGIDGEVFNRYVAGEITKAEMFATPYVNAEKLNFLIENREGFENVINKNGLSIYGDFFTWQKDNPEDLDKRIVTANGFDRSSVGGHNELFNSAFDERGNAGTGYSYDDDDWYVFTVHGHDMDSYGAYCGNVFDDRAFRDGGWGDLNREVITAKGKKFERTVIDTKNHIVVRVPYNQRK